MSLSLIPRHSFLSCVAVIALSTAPTLALAGTCSTNGNLNANCTIDNANPPVGALTVDAGVTVTIQQNPTVTQNITANVAGNSTFVIDTAATPTITGSIGTGGAFGNFIVRNNATLDLQGDVLANGNIRINSGATIIVRNGVTIDGDVDGDTNTATLRIDGHTSFNFQKDVSGVNLELVNGTIANTNGNGLGQTNTSFIQNRLFGATIDATSRFEIANQVRVLTSETVTNNGTLRLIEGGSLDSGLVTNNGTVQFSILTNSTGTITSTHDFTINAADIEILVDNGNSLNVGDEILLVTANTINGGAGLVSTSVTDNSATFDFEIADGSQAEITGSVDATQLWLRVLNAGGGGGGGGGLVPINTSNTNTRNVLSSAAINTAAVITDINTNLTNATTSQAYNALLESTLPNNARLNQTATYTIANQGLAQTQNRTRSLTTHALAPDVNMSIRPTGDIGVASGEPDTPASGNHYWVETYGSWASQDDNNTIAGYDLDTRGVTIGADSYTKYDDKIVGLTVGYARSELDSDDSNNTQLDSNQFSLSGYLTSLYSNNLFSTAILSYHYGRHDSLRSNVGGTGLSATASYDSHTLGASASLGRVFPVQSYGILTPTIGLNYYHFITQDYNESGAGNASLSVDSDSLDFLQAYAGLNTRWVYEGKNGGWLIPEIDLGLGYELLGEVNRSSSRFAAGGARFTTEGPDPEQLSYNASLGLTYRSTDSWDVKASYDYDGRDGYSAHTGRIRAIFHF